MPTLFRLCAIASLLCGGCRLMNDEPVVQGRSPLQPARASPDSVALEVIWARFPLDDPGLNTDVWQEIDETTLEPAIRRELTNNGLRAGVISGSLPGPIVRALRHGETTPDESTLHAVERSTQLAADPIVHGRVMRLRRNQRSEVQASEIFKSLPLLVNGRGELSGRTYQQAQAIYALRVDPRPDRTAIIELTPELHHGMPQVRLTGGDDGILRQASLRNREVFDRLRMTVRLAPGEMLVLMSLPDAGSRLGQYFHTVRSGDGPQQKLILIRLAEIPPSDTFAAR